MSGAEEWIKIHVLRCEDSLQQALDDAEECRQAWNESQACVARAEDVLNQARRLTVRDAED